MNTMMNLKNIPVSAPLTYETESSWNNLQPPVHSTSIASDDLRLLSALDQGWQVVEALHILASGRNDEGDSYLLSLMHPRRMQVRKMRVRATAGMKCLLDNEHVPMV